MNGIRLHCAALGAAIVAGGACSDPVGGEAHFIVGAEWEWMSACCGIAGQELTPLSEGVDYVLEFGEDGRVRGILDGVVVIETGYEVHTSRPDPLAPDEITTITYDDPLPLVPGVEPTGEHILFSLEGGGILLRSTATCNDCFRDWEFLPRLTIQ